MLSYFLIPDENRIDHDHFSESVTHLPVLQSWPVTNFMLIVCRFVHLTSLMISYKDQYAEVNNPDLKRRIIILQLSQLSNKLAYL